MAYRPIDDSRFIPPPIRDGAMTVTSTSSWSASPMFYPPQTVTTFADLPSVLPAGFIGAFGEVTTTDTGVVWVTCYDPVTDELEFIRKYPFLITDPAADPDVLHIISGPPHLDSRFTISPNFSGVEGVDWQAVTTGGVLKIETLTSLGRYEVDTTLVADASRTAMVMRDARANYGSGSTGIPFIYTLQSGANGMFIRADNPNFTSQWLAGAAAVGGRTGMDYRTAVRTLEYYRKGSSVRVYVNRAATAQGTYTVGTFNFPGVFAVGTGNRTSFAEYSKLTAVDY